MIGHILQSIRRELWEHRSIVITPAAIGIIVSLGVLAMVVFASGFANELDVAIFSAQDIAGEAERRAVLTGFFVGTSWVFIIALAILTVFYCLDSLYAERKDKSILFWRSLPVTDTETVLSKLLTAVLVIPVIMSLGIFATHLVNLIITSFWVSAKGGAAGSLIWGSISIFDNWLTALIVLVASGLWMAPFIGWFLFVSTWAKRMPILWAFMPPILLSMCEGIFFRTRVLATTIGERMDMTPLFKIGDLEGFFEDEEWRSGVENISLLDMIDLFGFLTSAGLWLGFAVCAVFVGGAIYVRRYLGDT